MGSSSGGTPKPPAEPQLPAGSVAPFGSTAKFDPAFSSILRGGTDPSQLGDQPQMLTASGAPAPTTQVGPGGGAGGGVSGLTPAIVAGLLQQGMSPQALISMGADPRDVMAAAQSGQQQRPMSPVQRNTDRGGGGFGGGRSVGGSPGGMGRF